MSTKNKTIAIVGATGAQGGSVVKKFLEDPEYKVRGITRKVDSDKAKALTAKGVEMVSANLDDEASLIKAFEGADVVFAVTNWWEEFASRGFDPHEAGKQEHRQCLNLHNAASKTADLKHYIWSTLEPLKDIFVPHMDYKASSNKYIEDDLKDLWAKTTFLVVGYYPTNIEGVPMLKPIATSPYSPHIQTLPCSPTTKCPSAGSITHNVGLFVHAIISKPVVTLPGKYVILQTDYISLADQLQIYSEITNLPMIAVQFDGLDTYKKIWGPMGTELELNFQAFMKIEEEEGWLGREGRLGAKELGVEGEVHDTRKALEELWKELSSKDESTVDSAKDGTEANDVATTANGNGSNKLKTKSKRLSSILAVLRGKSEHQDKPTATT